MNALGFVAGIAGIAGIVLVAPQAQSQVTPFEVSAVAVPSMVVNVAVTAPVLPPMLERYR